MVFPSGFWDANSEGKRHNLCYIKIIIKKFRYYNRKRSLLVIGTSWLWVSYTHENSFNKTVSESEDNWEIRIGLGN